MKLSNIDSILVQLRPSPFNNGPTQTPKSAIPGVSVHLVLVLPFPLCGFIAMIHPVICQSNGMSMIAFYSRQLVCHERTHIKSTTSTFSVLPTLLFPLKCWMGSLTSCSKFSVLLALFTILVFLQGSARVGYLGVLNEPVLLIPLVLALLGDNPDKMQSEFACHIGLRGRLFYHSCFEGSKGPKKSSFD